MTRVDLADLSDSEVCQRLEHRGLDPLAAAHLIHLRNRNNSEAIGEILRLLNR